MHKCIQLLLMQPVFEEVQSAFIRYGIEVVAWEDVPIAVQKLAHKQGKDPLPDGELCFCLQTIVRVYSNNAHGYVGIHGSCIKSSRLSFAARPVLQVDRICISMVAQPTKPVKIYN